MLSAEQTGLVRTQIAAVLNVALDRVVPEARLFADLGGTPDHLKPLRLAIEAALPVQIEPITNEINARTAVDNDGLLTETAQSQIVDYLGKWPGLPKNTVSFLDLFTVGMIEAIVAKAAAGAPVAPEPPLELTAEQKTLIYAAVAKISRVKVELLHPEYKFETPGEDFNFKFTQALTAASRTLHLDIGVELKEMVDGLDAYSKGTATPLTLQKLRRLLPNVESLPDDGEDHTSTLGVIERICASAIGRRQTPASALGHDTRDAMLGRYISGWPEADREWWAHLPEQMGAGKYRLYLAGMLRAAFVERGSLDRQINEALEVAEDYAETGHSAELLEKRFRGVSSWKLGRSPLWSGLLNILKPECTVEDGGPILERVEHTFEWKQAQLIAAARAWQLSFVSPLKDPAEFDGTFVTEEIATLARQMNDARIFVDFPKLGTLLEAAGCKVPAILEHCSDPKRRHLRGDWLIAAILAAAPVAPKKASRAKSAGAAAKPKKIKFPTMSARVRKGYKEHLTRHNGAIPAASAWAASWQSNHAAQQAQYQRDYPDLPSDVLLIVGGLYPSRINFLPAAAIARRMELQSAADLYVGLSLWARMSLVIWHTKPYRSDHFEILRDAFAAGDAAAVKWAVREFPYEPDMDSEVECWPYLALRAIATKDDALAVKVIDRWPHPPKGGQASRFETGLLAVLKRDAAGVVALLNLILDEERGADEPEGFGVMSMTAHALHRATMWFDPALVTDFDVTQTFPWDAEFHAVSTANPDPLADFDFSNTPPVLRDLLLTQVVPQWLVDMPQPPRTGQEMVYCHVTEIGPKPEAVVLVMEKYARWNEEEFAHRMAKLPQTVYVVKYLADRFCDEMQTAGATVVKK